MQFLMDVQRGLSSEKKQLDSKYLYDARGSALFDQICELEEYYLTRTESVILREHAGSMAGLMGERPVIVELGSGSSTKTRILLDHVLDAKAYLPVDISEEHLLRTAGELSQIYPELVVEPIVGDFTEAFNLPHRFAGENVTLYFPGSTIGNLEHDQATDLLRSIASLQDQAVGLLIGFDLVKDHAVLEPAYNDAAGVSAAFTLNLLRRINRELGADFDLQQFEHVAFFNEQLSRIEIYIESQCDQQVCLDGQLFDFELGERVRTEYSHKYTLDGFSQMAATAGFRAQHAWTDVDAYFAVMYLTSE